jgi:hypothetical protein
LPQRLFSVRRRQAAAFQSPPNQTLLNWGGGEIENAVRSGDCQALYNFIIEAGPVENYAGTGEKGKESEQKRKLVEKANAGLRAYTTHDKNTEKYQTGKIDPYIRDVPPVMARQVFATPETVLPQVVSALQRRTPSAFDKVKAFHDWICDNIAYDYEMLASGKRDGQDYASVLKKKKALCSGYANLLKKMCELAGIEALVIDGSLKSKDYGWTGKVPSGDHAWNAVFLNNKWYLVDATLDAGFVVNMKAFVKRYSTEYLFLDSRSFLYTHFPQKPERQFYGPPLDAETFEKEPAVPGIFFQYGLSLGNDAPLDTNTTTNGVFTFNIHHSKLNVEVKNEISDGDQWEYNGKEKGAKTTVAGYLLPDPPSGEYQCKIYARYDDEFDFKREIDAETFENTWLKRLRDLRDENRITLHEFGIFKGAYTKVESAGKYYFNEDLFDTNRNNVVQKLSRLLDEPLKEPRAVLEFKLKGK